GDFNLKRWDITYKALTGKDNCAINLPESNTYEISYRCNVKQILKTAYRQRNESEPAYTNFVDTDLSLRFCDTLDYIFFYGDPTVEDVLELPDKSSNESYPNQINPSYHLMIAATFRL
ncbi:unnamed protein product, partial [Rotaria sp. Silwood2]